jgi:hypothetical protein
MSEEKKRLLSASGSNLPIASVIDDHDTFARAVELLKKAVRQAAKKSEAEEEIERIKAELGAICEAYGLKGLRHGLNGFSYSGWTTRKTLSKERLLAQGVSAEQIDAAYAESEPFVYARIVPFDIE